MGLLWPDDDGLGAGRRLLPRSSSAQIGVGTRVSKSQLQPGDLVFFYSPISHVGIYLGNGEIVHATHPGDVVSVDPMSYMPFSVRPVRADRPDRAPAGRFPHLRSTREHDEGARAPSFVAVPAACLRRPDALPFSPSPGARLRIG